MAAGMIISIILVVIILLVVGYFVLAYFLHLPPFTARSAQLQELVPTPETIPDEPFTSLDNISFIHNKAGDTQLIRYGKKTSRDECQSFCANDNTCVGYNWFSMEAEPAWTQSQCYGIPNKVNYPPEPHVASFSGLKN